MKVSDYHYTLSEVAEDLHLSRERVRQIETTALIKCRALFEAQGITATTLDDYVPDHGPGLFDVNDRTAVLHYRNS